MRTASPIPRAGQPPAAHNPDGYKWAPLDACLEAIVSVATGFRAAGDTKGTRANLRAPLRPAELHPTRRKGTCS